MIEKNRIYFRDCVLGIKKLPDSSIDIIIVDPPYNIGKDFGNDSDKRNIRNYIEWVQSWLSECQRVLKLTGTMFIYGFDEILAHISVLLPIEQQRWLIWHYTNKNIPSLNFWQRSHESIICYWRDKPIFNRDAVREPYTVEFLNGSAGRRRPAGNGRFAANGGKETIYQANENGALPRDVISQSTLAGGAALKERIIYCKDCERIVEPAKRKKHDGHELIIHPTQKPLELTNKLINSCKPFGDYNVLIPFCGSGSECISVINNVGNYIAYEINSDYVLLAEKNIKYFKKKNNHTFWEEFSAGFIE
ncbi:MAG: site-specific DNA-methyltransferase [Deferribacteraceae bacterium]|jgi:site-specific DNA-methyltransferase (adenine-specific)|nr:site-specific DNA-methyltransferase [Deferribacteraceae bacterium]